MKSDHRNAYDTRHRKNAMNHLLITSAHSVEMISHVEIIKFSKYTEHRSITYNRSISTLIIILQMCRVLACGRAARTRHVIAGTCSGQAGLIGSARAAAVLLHIFWPVTQFLARFSVRPAARDRGRAAVHAVPVAKRPHVPACPEPAAARSEHGPAIFQNTTAQLVRNDTVLPDERFAPPAGDTIFRRN